MREGIAVGPCASSLRRAVMVLSVAMPACGLIVNDDVPAPAPPPIDAPIDTCTAPKATTLEAVPVVTGLAVGERHSCALLKDRTVACWGGNDAGQSGGCPAEDRSIPKAVPGLVDAVEIAAGDTFTCARLQRGAVRCWGSNAYGQLGDGHPIDRQMSPSTVRDLDDVEALALGAHHACALRRDRTVACWGGNHAGQLGDGTTVDRLAPTRVFGLRDVKAIAAGGHRTCALLGDGTVSCWGAEPDLSKRESEIPGVARVLPTLVAGVASGTHLSVSPRIVAVRTASGAVWWWGARATSSVDDPGVARTPLAFDGRCDATLLIARYQGVTCLQADGSLMQWSDGTPLISGPAALLRISELRVAPDAVAGREQVAHHGCLRQGGAVSCWGSNNQAGQIGDGTFAPRRDAVAVKWR